MLYSHGASFGSTSQATNLITAASEGDIEEVQALLEFGCIREIISHGDWDNRTSLHVAAAQGQTKIVELLCEAGASVNIRDRWGNRPLDDANNAKNCFIDQDSIAHISELLQDGAQRPPE